MFGCPVPENDSNLSQPIAPAIPLESRGRHGMIEVSHVSDTRWLLEGNRPQSTDTLFSITFLPARVAKLADAQGLKILILRLGTVAHDKAADGRSQYSCGSEQMRLRYPNAL